MRMLRKSVCRSKTSMLRNKFLRNLSKYYKRFVSNRYLLWIIAMFLLRGLTLSLLSERNVLEYGIRSDKQWALYRNIREKYKNTRTDSNITHEDNRLIKTDSPSKLCDTMILNGSKYHGHNLMCDDAIAFDQNFKNPCWYQNSTLRCLPYFYLMGVKKTGTTDLFNRICEHPDYVKWGGDEAQFFARKRFAERANDNINFYIDMFKKAAESIERQRDKYGKNLKSITAEKSPSNLHLNSHWQYLPENEGLDQPRYVILDYIKHFLPHSKMIVSFRNPTDRLYSDYYHEYGLLSPDNVPTPYQFHDVVLQGLQLYSQCFKHHSLRTCVYNATLYDILKIQMQLGIYHVYWEELTRLFSRDQILIVHNEHGHGNSTMAKVFSVLGMETLSDSEMGTIERMKVFNTRSKVNRARGPMLDITRTLLDNFYRPFNMRMARLTGDDTFLYGQR